MDASELHLPEHQRTILSRFITACQADERVVAAFLGGSYAKGTADIFSDLDLGVIIADEAYSDFFAGREAFVRRLGEPLFLRTYSGGGFDNLSFILSNDTESDLALGRASNFTHIHVGPYKTLLDKTGCLVGAVFAGQQPTQAEQTETLHDLIDWFWHNLLHHFITPISRGQLWSAYGALEDMRLACVNLVRLKEDFNARAEGYERIDQALPIEQLAPLQATFCPLERTAMIQSAQVIVNFYQGVALSLAQAHGLPYPADLARMLSERLEQLGQAPVE